MHSSNWDGAQLDRWIREVVKNNPEQVIHLFRGETNVRDRVAVLTMASSK